MNEKVGLHRKTYAVEFRHRGDGILQNFDIFRIKKLNRCIEKWYCIGTLLKYRQKGCRMHLNTYFESKNLKKNLERRTGPPQTPLQWTPDTSCPYPAPIFSTPAEPLFSALDPLKLICP